MSFPDAFPDDILEEIRRFPGNDKCCDCMSLSTDWASVSHGILICLECAGKHRSLGVQNSFVRSITMDTWSQRQVRDFYQFFMPFLYLFSLEDRNDGSRR